MKKKYVMPICNIIIVKMEDCVTASSVSFTTGDTNNDSSILAEEWTEDLNEDNWYFDKNQ